jgi:hypothetical protein
MVGCASRTMSVPQVLRLCKATLLRRWKAAPRLLPGNATAWQWHGGERFELLSGYALQEAEQWLQARPAAAEAPTALQLEYIKAGRDGATQLPDDEPGRRLYAGARPPILPYSVLFSRTAIIDARTVARAERSRNGNIAVVSNN